ncbi:hypothetical protein TDB9533_03873 [Thalassocella blandensis]|nr:hypothetical protein TDB9533_03873 [Thalassocella blandensis]
MTQETGKPVKPGIPKKLERRNGHAFHPIMRKGGPHEKTKKAKRAAAKRDTQRKASEWLSRSFLNTSLSFFFRSFQNSAHD